MSTIGSLMEPRERTQFVQISKVGAGYVYRKGTDYRCRDCWKWIPKTFQCAEMGQRDIARKIGYCIVWAFGTPRPGLVPTGAYTPEQIGYGELPNGTKCYRCEHFGPQVCEIVKGKIDRDACCNNQEPK